MEGGGRWGRIGILVGNVYPKSEALDVTCSMYADESQLFALSQIPFFSSSIPDL